MSTYNRRVILLLAALALAEPSCRTAKIHTLNRRPNVMKLEFKRTGGFSPITNASGAVEFNDDSGEVTSSTGNYRRSLSSDELTSLRDLANPQNLAAQPTQAAPDAVRDGFTYEVTITTSDGKQHTVSSSQLQKLPSAAAQLINWVQQESQKILAHRASGG